MPGSDERKLAKASTLTVDSVVLDLEDGVAVQRKAEARVMVAKALEVQSCHRVAPRDSDKAPNDCRPCR